MSPHPRSTKPGLTTSSVCNIRDCTYRVSSDGDIDTAIHITEEEFKHYNKEGIALGDGSGYLATTTAYHDLHCIVSQTHHPKVFD